VDSGPLASGLRFLGSILRYFTALGGLAQIEAKEAATIYIKVAVYLVLGLIFLVFGYIFFILFVAFSLALLFGISWIWITLGLVVFHAILAVICAYSIREGIRSPVFTATAAELRKDMEAFGAIQPKSPAVSPMPSQQGA
jgi:uncharacterized membrane protein YqjE